MSGWQYLSGAESGVRIGALIANLTKLKHISLNDCRLFSYDEIVKNARDGLRVDLFHNFVDIPNFILISAAEAPLAFAAGVAPVRWTMWVNNNQWNPSACTIATLVAIPDNPLEHTFAPFGASEVVRGTHIFPLGGLRLHMAIAAPPPNHPSQLPADWPLRPPDDGA